MTARLLAQVGAGVAACDGGGTIPIGADRGQGACSATFEDPLQLTALGPTDRSHWLQPWRAYQETWPTARLRRAIALPFGIDAVDSRRGPVFASSGVARGSPVFRDVLRFDMPPETFELTVDGVHGRVALVEASDSMVGSTLEVSVVWRGERRVVVAVPLTDAPRLLTITEP